MSRELARHEHNYDELLAPSHAGVMQHHGGHEIEHGGHHGGHPQHGGHAPHGGHAGHHPGHHAPHAGPPVEVHHHHHPQPPPPPGRTVYVEQPAPPPPGRAAYVDDDRRRRGKSTSRERNERNREDGHSPDRLFPIGFYELNIPGNQEADIVVQPQVEFQGKRLAIPLEIARNFDVIDIKVGKDSQLAATGVLAGSCFSTTAVDVWMELDWAEPGIVITLRVVNNTSATHDFKAVMYGRVRDD